MSTDKRVAVGLMIGGLAAVGVFQAAWGAVVALGLACASFGWIAYLERKEKAQIDKLEEMLAALTANHGKEIAELKNLVNTMTMGRGFGGLGL